MLEEMVRTTTTRSMFDESNKICFGWRQQVCQF